MEWRLISWCPSMRTYILYTPSQLYSCKVKAYPKAYMYAYCTYKIYVYTHIFPALPLTTLHTFTYIYANAIHPSLLYKLQGIRHSRKQQITVSCVAHWLSLYKYHEYWIRSVLLASQRPRLKQFNRGGCHQFALRIWATIMVSYCKSFFFLVCRRALDSPQVH